MDMDSVDEDETSAEAESQLSAVCANVMRDVVTQHPIIFFDLNICELVQKCTLITLGVARLRDIWIDLGLDFSDNFTSEVEKAIHCTTTTISPGVYLFFQITEQ